MVGGEEREVPFGQLVRGHLYRLHSRNLDEGVYDGERGFVGIRLKFGSIFLATEFHYSSEHHGTAWPLEDRGPIPEGLVPQEGATDQREDEPTRRENDPLFDFMAERWARLTGLVYEGGEVVPRRSIVERERARKARRERRGDA